MTTIKSSFSRVFPFKQNLLKKGILSRNLSTQAGGSNLSLSGDNPFNDKSNFTGNVFDFSKYIANPALGAGRFTPFLIRLRFTNVHDFTFSQKAILDILGVDESKLRSRQLRLSPATPLVDAEEFGGRVAFYRQEVTLSNVETKLVEKLNTRGEVILDEQDKSILVERKVTNRKVTPVYYIVFTSESLFSEFGKFITDKSAVLNALKPEFLHNRYRDPSVVQEFINLVEARKQETLEEKNIRLLKQARELQESTVAQQATTPTTENNSKNSLTLDQSNASLLSKKEIQVDENLLPNFLNLLEMDTQRVENAVRTVHEFVKQHYPIQELVWAQKSDKVNECLYTLIRESLYCDRLSAVVAVKSDELLTGDTFAGWIQDFVRVQGQERAGLISLRAKERARYALMNETPSYLLNVSPKYGDAPEVRIGKTTETRSLLAFLTQGSMSFQPEIRFELTVQKKAADSLFELFIADPMLVEKCIILEYEAILKQCISPSPLLASLRSLIQNFDLEPARNLLPRREDPAAALLRKAFDNITKAFSLYGNRANILGETVADFIKNSYLPILKEYRLVATLFQLSDLTKVYRELFETKAESIADVMQANAAAYASETALNVLDAPGVPVKLNDIAPRGPKKGFRSFANDLVYEYFDLSASRRNTGKTYKEFVDVITALETVYFQQTKDLPVPINKQPQVSVTNPDVVEFQKKAPDCWAKFVTAATELRIFLNDNERKKRLTGKPASTVTSEIRKSEYAKNFCESLKNLLELPFEMAYRKLRVLNESDLLAFFDYLNVLPSEKSERAKYASLAVSKDAAGNYVAPNMENLEQALKETILAVLNSFGNEIFKIKPLTSSVWRGPLRPEIQKQWAFLGTAAEITVAQGISLVNPDQSTNNSAAGFSFPLSLPEEALALEKGKAEKQRQQVEKNPEKPVQNIMLKEQTIAYTLLLEIEKNAFAEFKQEIQKNYFADDEEGQD